MGADRTRLLGRVAQCLEVRDQSVYLPRVSLRHCALLKRHRRLIAVIHDVHELLGHTQVDWQSRTESLCDITLHVRLSHNRQDNGLALRRRYQVTLRSCRASQGLGIVHRGMKRPDQRAFTTQISSFLAGKSLVSGEEKTPECSCVLLRSKAQNMFQVALFKHSDQSIRLCHWGLDDDDTPSKRKVPTFSGARKPAAPKLHGA